MATSNPTAAHVSAEHGPRTHGGAMAAPHKDNPITQLRRTCMSALLFEDQHYEAGTALAARVRELVNVCSIPDVCALAVECRDKMHLRHMPLYLVACLTQHPAYTWHPKIVPATLEHVVQRPDEMTEFCAIYWNVVGRKPGRRQITTLGSRTTPNCVSTSTIGRGVRRALARAFTKFDAYSLAKYRGDDRHIKLRDVLRMVRPKPANAAQSALWSELRRGTLKSVDTWETELSAGKDKKATFERLLAEKKLGGLAFLRNLRNMEAAGVDPRAIRERFAGHFHRVLPFRFLSAARAAKKYEPEIDLAMCRTASAMPKLAGHTVFVIDVSGSMQNRLSDKSELTRLDAAAALAVLVRERCASVSIWLTAGSDSTRVHRTEMIAPRHGMALVDQITDVRSRLGGGGIFLVQCLDAVSRAETEPCARLLIFTDEQDCDKNLNPQSANAFGAQNYMMNVASYANSINFGKFTQVNGFSEHLLEFIEAHESQNAVLGLAQ